MILFHTTVRFQLPVRERLVGGTGPHAGNLCIAKVLRDCLQLLHDS